MTLGKEVSDGEGLIVLNLTVFLNFGHAPELEFDGQPVHRTPRKLFHLLLSPSRQRRHRGLKIFCSWEAAAHTGGSVTRVCPWRAYCHLFSYLWRLLLCPVGCWGQEATCVLSFDQSHPVCPNARGSWGLHVPMTGTRVCSRERRGRRKEMASGPETQVSSSSKSRVPSGPWG